MFFGWRPQASCYGQSSQLTLTDTPMTNCQGPTWWYLLMAGALVGGLMARKK